MAHPLEAVIREAYAAFARGDLDGYLGACTDDFAFHVPGTGAMAGDYCGRDGLYALAAKVMSIAGGSFVEDVDDVLANDSHAVVLATHSLTRDGVRKEYRTAHVYDVRDGKLAECWEQPRDPVCFDDAWGARACP